MTRSRITIRDVAASAGVSHQTVSRVINNSDQVRPETRMRVEAAIAELGYRPNEIARFMAKGRTGSLACLAPNLTDYTFSSIIEGAQVEARRHGFFLLSASAPDRETFESLIDELLASGRAEGVLVINPYADDRQMVLPPNIPVVFAGARPRAEGMVSSVALDDVRVGEMATRHLLNLGHRRIGMVTGPMVEDCSQDRHIGYLRALEQAGLYPEDALVVVGDWTASSGYHALQQLADRGDLPSAVFVQNDRMAVGVLRAARDMGLRIPEQLSVIGVDDIPLSSYFAPPLTTIRQDFATIGQEAARLLIEAVIQPDAGSHQQLRIPAELIVRRSTGEASQG